MFGNLEGNDWEHLDEETRVRLGNFLRMRNEYNEHLIRLNEMKIRVLANPAGATTDETIVDYASSVVAPLRSALSEETIEFFKKAVDMEHIKSMLPMMLMVLTQAVNIPLLMTAFGIDPDQIAELVNKVKETISGSL